VNCPDRSLLSGCSRLQTGSLRIVNDTHRWRVGAWPARFSERDLRYGRSREPWIVPCPIESGAGDESATMMSRGWMFAEIMKAMEQAFDQASTEIADTCGDRPAEIQSARLSQAKARLSIPSEAGRDVAILMARALS
jgi:hypothetical protein